MSIDVLFSLGKTGIEEELKTSEATAMEPHTFGFILFVRCQQEWNVQEGYNVSLVFISLA